VFIIIVVGMIANQCDWYLARGLQVQTAGKYVEYKKGKTRGEENPASS
jgi:hypothetical protein